MADEKNKKNAPTAEDLKAKVATLEAKVDMLEAAIAEGLKPTGGSSVKIADAPKAEEKPPVIPKPFKHEGKTITFKVPRLRWKGANYEAEALKSDKAMLSELLEANPNGCGAFGVS